MTFGKVLVLSLGFVGAVALGVWTGPYLTDRADLVAPAGQVAAADAQSDRAETAAMSRRSTAAAVPAVPASEPDLHKRLKPVLTSGANLTIASEGFRSGEQFAAVAHAARNIGAPFAVLKHRVVLKRMSLASAIHDVKPEVDAVAEANRASIMARADIVAIAG